MREKEVLSVRNSRKIYIPVYFMILVLFLAVGAIKFYGKEMNDWAFRGVLIFSAVGIFWTEMHRLRYKYEITENAVIHIKGLLVRTIKKTDIHALSDAELKQNPWQRILGIGNVSANAFSEITILKNVSKPHQVIKFLEEKMAEKNAHAPANAKARR